MSLDFVALPEVPRAWAKYVKFLNKTREIGEPELLQGSFARVILERTSAVKITCCPATHILFDRLLELGESAPAGLPRVYEGAGQVASCEEALWQGYRIELLSHESSTAHDRCLDAILIAAKKKETANYTSDPRAALALARKLATDDRWGLASAWELIANVVETHGVVIDTMHKQNVLRRANGQICIADAVGPC